MRADDTVLERMFIESYFLCGEIQWMGSRAFVYSLSSVFLSKLSSFDRMAATHSDYFGRTEGAVCDSCAGPHGASECCSSTAYLSSLEATMWANAAAFRRRRLLEEAATSCGLPVTNVVEAAYNEVASGTVRVGNLPPASEIGASPDAAAAILKKTVTDAVLKYVRRTWDHYVPGRLRTFCFWQVGSDQAIVVVLMCPEAASKRDVLPWVIPASITIEAVRSGDVLFSDRTMYFKTFWAPITATQSVDPEIPDKVRRQVQSVDLETYLFY